MVPNIEQDYILLLGYSILYREYYLTRFNHQKSTTRLSLQKSSCHVSVKSKRNLNKPGWYRDPKADAWNGDGCFKLGQTEDSFL